MNFDKDSIRKLLKLSDDELGSLIKDLAKEAGGYGNDFSVSSADIKKIRAFLTFAKEDEIAALLKQFGGKK